MYLWLILVLGNLLPTPEAPPAVIVTLRDAQGAPLAGVAVLAYDRGGTVLFARAMTDDTGVASFSMLPVGEARIVIRGHTPDGIELRQPGAEVTGVFLILTAPPTRLDLVVDADGMVRPDPATMIAPESDIPLVPSATAILTPTATTAALVAPTVTPELPVAEPSTSSFPWLGIALVTILLALLLAGLAWLSRTRAQ